MKSVDQVLAAFEISALNAGLSRNTRKSYAATIGHYTRMLQKREITGPQEYFDYLASGKKLASKTVWHALNPLKFLYEKVLLREFGDDYKLPKRDHSKPMRSVLGMNDILRMMDTMDRVQRLQTGLLAGCGLRIVSDMLTLRIKDVRLSDRIITIYEAKGDKTRPVRIPEMLVEEMATQIRACRRLWEKDRMDGIIYPHPQESLMRKLGKRTFGTFPWMYLFPSSIERNQQRWHATDKKLVSALKDAAEICGITQRVNPHALRHSYATNLMRQGTDIKVIQEQMGHTSIETTALYLHTAGSNTVQSPLDRAMQQSDIITPFRKLA
jgi:site-specific recombinase XerD